MISNEFAKESGSSSDIRNQKGAALFIVILLMSILVLIPVMLNTSRISSENTKVQRAVVLMADNIAQAGLIDAVKWFKRQPAQPVSLQTYWARGGTGVNPDLAFYPRSEPDPSKPTQNDTINESIGLVKEYQLSDKYEELNAAGDLKAIGKSQIWGRYEVVRASAVGYNPNAVHDITGVRIPAAAAGDGMVWQIESKGYIYSLSDKDKPFDQFPNKVISKSRTSTEIWRLNVKLPVDAALIVNNLSSVTILDPGSGVSGLDHPGIAYYTKDVSGYDAVGSSVSGNPPTMDVSSAAENAIDPRRIFGVSPAKLRELADISAASFDDLSDGTPEGALVYISTHAVINANHYNSYSDGILYVNGNLRINNNGSYKLRANGLIFVDGNLEITGTCLMRGAVVVTGKVILSGAGIQLIYSNDVLNSSRRQLAQYRENRSAIHATTSFLK